MATTITELYTGTSTIGSTEYSLTSDSTTLGAIASDAVLQVMLDTSALAAADEFELAVKEKVVSGGSQAACYTAAIVGTAGDRFVSPAIMVKHGWEVTLKKIAGTDRSIPWSLRTPG